MITDIQELADRIDLIEKKFREHLGPAYAISALNLPHQDAASATSLTALTTRVTTAEANITTLQTQMTAAQAAINTAGRYL